MEAIQRIKEVLTYSTLSVRSFAAKCGLPQPTLDKQLKGLRGISLDTMMGVLYAYPEISAEWLMRGEGAMLIPEHTNSAAQERTNKLVDTITTLQDAINQKNDTIASLSERVKQLESQLNSK